MAKAGSLKFWIILGVIVAIFLPPFARYQEMSYKKRKLENDIRKLNQEIKTLQVQKMRLETDITYIEERAREKMGVVRKGEVVLKDRAGKR